MADRYYGGKFGVSRIGVVEAGSATPSNDVELRVTYDAAAAGRLPLLNALSHIQARIKQGDWPPSIPLDIKFSSNIPNLLAALRSSSSQRVNIGWHGMSVDVGVGSDGTSTFKESWRSTALPAVVSAQINTDRGGTFTRGIELVSSTDNLNPMFTLGGSASLQAAYAVAVGGCGQAVVLTGNSSDTLAFAVNGAIAGQVARVYGMVRGIGIAPRYALSGANTVAQTALPASVDDVVVGSSPYNWYFTDIVLANAGTTTVTLSGAVGAGDTCVFYGVDFDRRPAVPGLTIHRLAQQGHALGNAIAMSLDNSDATGPAGWLGSGNANKRASQLDSLTTRLGIQGAIASFDINDHLAYTFFGYGWSLADHRRHADNYLAAMKARNLEVLIVCGNLRNPSSASFSGIPYSQGDIIEQYRLACQASTNGAFLDPTARWPGVTRQEQFNAQVADTSCWLAAESPNYIHPSGAGHTREGTYIGTALKAALGV